MQDPLNADLSADATRAFLVDKDETLARAVATMESTETWTQDHEPGVQAALQRLSDAVEGLDLESMPAPVHDKLIVLLSYIKSGKALKFLLWIEATNPNFVAKTLAQAQMLMVLDRVNPGAAQLFMERIEVLETLHLLSRVFSAERFEMVERVFRILRSGADQDDDSND